MTWNYSGMSESVYPSRPCLCGTDQCNEVVTEDPSHYPTPPYGNLMAMTARLFGDWEIRNWVTLKGAGTLLGEWFTCLLPALMLMDNRIFS